MFYLFVIYLINVTIWGFCNAADKPRFLFDYIPRRREDEETMKADGCALK